ncbi:hypothetical protein [Carnobacterium divergens]|uniref:Uncharacterized protein n=1 Tax=Carnobacterium divergens TaxID=2748 RepID=A0AAW8RBS6_CARDV|nr:hypothetical protein [Carnobacterium divergens]MDT1958954.1 hypothetical protein [Carnobacterium divergens]MDT1974922.1 hypothetical protein [Carnobacterium divergens]MDT2012886.1 hypothetical protein [Carnobacterium divergens]
MSYNQFQAELSKIFSSNLQLPRLMELLYAAITIIWICLAIGFIRKSTLAFSEIRGFLKFLILISCIIIILVLTAIFTTFCKNNSEQEKLINTFIEDSSNFTWNEKRIDTLVPFPSSDGMDELVYLKICNDIYGYNSKKNNEIEYQEDKNEKTSKYDLYSVFFGDDKIYNYERSVYWSTDTKKVHDIPSKVSYEYKLKEDKFYKNKDKLPREFWRRIENNPKEKIVFYIPK